MRGRELTDKDRLTRAELIFIIIAATVTITFASTCSPLYPFNPWDDANCFFTLGRGITHGKVPYRDLYEQKGPLLYFIYALAALISEKAFTGAWIFECIMASVFAIFSWKTVKLFVTPPKYSIAMIPFLLSITYTLEMFNFGGNAEELCFPLLTVAMYIGLRSIVKGDGLPSGKEAFICGIITGILFWIKYTFIGFMGGFCIYILVLTIKRRSFARLWSLVWRFAVGFIVLTFPIIAYFAVTGSLKYLWEAYFYNVVAYHSATAKTASGLENVPVIRNIYIPILSLLATSRTYPGYGFMLLFSMISFVLILIAGRKHFKKAFFFAGITFVFAAGITFLRPLVIYYYGYILAYGFGLIMIPVCKGLETLKKAFKQNPKFMSGLVFALFTVFSMMFLLLNKNMYLIFQKRDYLAQFRYAETINQTPDAKILTYDVMDCGFYTAAGLLPGNRYYCYLSMEKHFPAILEEQDRLIKEGYYDYIITSYFCKADWDNYELIREETDDYADFTGDKVKNGFRLYKRTA